MQGKQVQQILAANVRRVRKALGFSQADLAEKTGLSPGYVSDIENSRKWPSADCLARLADVLKMDPYQLILPTEDSPYFDRHKTLTSFSRRVKDALLESVDEVFDSYLQPYGPLRPESTDRSED